MSIMERLKLPIIDIPKPVTIGQIILKSSLIGTEVISGVGAVMSLLGGQPTMALGLASLGSSFAAGDYLTTSMLRTDRILEATKRKVDITLEKIQKQHSNV